MAEPGAAVSLMQPESSSEDGVLLDHLQRIENSTKGCYAVHLHLSRLRPEYRKRHFLRIAARAFDALVNNFDTTLYLLSNFDFVLVCRDVPIDDADQPINRIRELFGEDPLTFTEVGSPDDRFTSWIDLSQPTAFDAFAESIREISSADQERRRKEGERGADGRPAGQRGEPLEPTNLTAVNDRLKNVRVADVIHRQAAISIVGGRPGGVIFHEYFIAMAEMQRRIAPGVNLFSSPWMFQYLTETMDRRMLSTLMRQDLRTLDEAISINLNIATVLSSGFHAFHNAIGPESARRVIVEMQTVDIFANMTAFENARAWLRERGYRVLLDGLNPLSLSFFDPGLLDLDYVKMNWSPEFHSGVPSDRLNDIRDLITHLGTEKMVLARVDSEEAIRWGLSLGVSCFQGHIIDRLAARMPAPAKS